MTIEKVIGLVDDLKPNQLTEEQKIQWLSQLDYRIFREILLKHEKDPAMPEEFSGYDADTAGGTELLAPPPYDEIYRWYLEMQIDLANMELEKYNNSAALYNNAWGEFARMWHREHMPRADGKSWRF